MSQFVVGQWVECVDDSNGLERGKCYKVDDVSAPDCDVPRVRVLGIWLFAHRFRPVTWEVGATYYTTLPGVTATITGRDFGGFVIGNDSRETPGYAPWKWNGVTGLLNNFEDDTTMPHLTPRSVVAKAKSEEADDSCRGIPVMPDAKWTVTQADPINPPHYQQHPSGVECIQVTEHMTFCLGNVVKYLWRAGQKGEAVQDLEKAAWYLDREIKRLKAGDA